MSILQCKNCQSYAINHSSHGRDGRDLDLCDVCYWKTRVEITDRSISLAVAQNKADLLAEDIECLHMCLDDIGIPRDDGNGNVYSMWGRVQKAIEKEREACAKLCDVQSLEPECPELAEYCANAIM